MCRMDVEGMKSQLYELSTALIDRLQLVRLWGYGFPEITFCVYVLRKYLT